MSRTELNAKYLIERLRHRSILEPDHALYTNWCTLYLHNYACKKSWEMRSAIAWKMKTSRPNMKDEMAWEVSAAWKHRVPVISTHPWLEFHTSKHIEFWAFDFVHTQSSLWGWDKLVHEKDKAHPKSFPTNSEERTFRNGFILRTWFLVFVAYRIFHRGVRVEPGIR